ncbi:hypothetical protein ACFUIY_23945 [Streptomyces griseorubiginosus]|uniref:hypothetical protein n=1 Tax=Streptomyces griseorubiginosus TaxID=67304 RepID=UPI003633836F
MGAFVGVRGRLECDDVQLAQVMEIVQADDPEETYSGGWAFPPRQYHYAHWVFFGAHMRAQSVDWFLDRLRSVARIPASDDDNDLVTGLFLVSHEVDGMSEWQVRDGTVRIRAAGQDHRYLDE